MMIEADAVLTAGYLNIGNLAGSTGIVTATGAGSEIIDPVANGGVNVGFSGSGTLLLESGAAFVADFLNIGQNAGSIGAVTVTDPGTTVNTTAGQFQNIGVGFDGTASLTIANHASVTTTYMDVGINYDAGIPDTLDINNATLTVGSYLTIGDAGAGSATIENGGILNTGGLTIGNQASGVGSLTVDGAGSVVSTNNLSLSSQGGSADLSLTNGGAVDVGPATTIAGAVHVASGFNLQGSGTIHGALVDDGYVAASGTLEVTGNTTGSGTLSIAAGAHLELDSSVASTDTVIFQNSQSSDTGSLTLTQSSSFAALIDGFAGNGTLAGSDQIDLKDINYASLSETFTQGSGQSPNTLSLSDGTHTAVLQFVGSYVQANFNFASDVHGGTIVYDPPVSNGKAPPSDKPVGMDHLAFNFDNFNHGGQPSTLLEDLGMSAHMATWDDGQPDSHQNHPGPGQGGWQALLQGHDAPIPDTIAPELHASQFHYHLV
jgi:T5SS/PEP-CTERM-associated repeat protein